MIIQTAIGPAGVTHRLALAVEIRDAITNRLAATPVRVGRELAGQAVSAAGGRPRIPAGHARTSSDPAQRGSSSAAGRGCRP